MKSFDKLTQEIGINYQSLDNFVTYADAHYNTFYILKRNKKKKRQIDSPSKDLKAIQRWLVHNYLNDINISDRANAFVPKRGIKRNATPHLNSNHVLKIDLKDFFSSISQKMIVTSLSKHSFDKDLVIKLSKLCTYKRKLPQGAPTSPILSNIVFSPIDIEIAEVCNLHSVIYTRYADDLVFSSDTKDVLPTIYQKTSKILYRNNFRINHSKTQYLSGKGRMSITGININSGKLTLGREIKRNLRAALYNIIINKDRSINENSIKGYLSYLKDIEPDYFKKIEAYIEKLKKIRTAKRIEAQKSFYRDNPFPPPF